MLSPLRMLIGQEQLADRIVAWSLTLVLGLLQIAPYMRAVVERSAMPMEAEEAVRVKLERQAIFHRDRDFVFYVHEQALRLPVGGQDVMRAQLLHILTMTIRPYITVRVLPSSAGAHAGVAGSFVQLKFEKYLPVIFVEGARTGSSVEVGRGVGIRDSKAPATHLPVSDEAWSAFLTEVKAGR